MMRFCGFQAAASHQIMEAVMQSNPVPWGPESPEDILGYLSEEKRSVVEVGNIDFDEIQREIARRPKFCASSHTLSEGGGS
jgi:hypothetical protein